jgi:hypothetical protein
MVHNSLDFFKQTNCFTFMNKKTRRIMNRSSLQEITYFISEIHAYTKLTVNGASMLHLIICAAVPVVFAIVHSALKLAAALLYGY